jgi:hypothetical protein
VKEQLSAISFQFWRFGSGNGSVRDAGVSNQFHHAARRVGTRRIFAVSAPLAKFRAPELIFGYSERYRILSTRLRERISCLRKPVW